MHFFSCIDFKLLKVETNWFVILKTLLNGISLLFLFYIILHLFVQL